MLPAALADYIEKWYEGGRRGLTILEDLESDNIEDYMVSARRWFYQGDQRIQKVLSQLRGVELIDSEADDGAIDTMTSVDLNKSSQGS